MSDPRDRSAAPPPIPLRAALALALGVILAATAVAYRNVRELFDEATWVSHTQHVRTELAALLESVRDAETSERAFLLTGDESLLKSFDATRESIAERVRRLGSLVADNPDQERRLRELEPHVDAGVASLQRGIVARRERGLDAARRHVAEGGDTREMNAVRDGVAGMDAVEEVLLRRRSVDMDRAAETAAATFAIAALVATVAIMLLYVLLRRFLAALMKIERDREELLGREHAARVAAEEAERRARELGAYNEAVMTYVSEGLYTVDVNGLVTFMNPEAERLFGWSAADLRGRKMHDATHHHHPDGRPFPAAECPGLGVLRTGVVLRDHEDTFIRKDGTFFPVVFSATRLVSSGEVRGVVVVFRDVTRQKAADAEREQLLRRTEEARAAAEGAAAAEREARSVAESASRTKDTFLASISHELRTPLSPILTWAHMLQRPDVPTERHAHGLAVIDRCARTQAQLIEDLLDVSRIVAGKMRMEIRPVSIVSVIDAAVDVVRPAAEAKAIRLTTVLDTEVSQVLGDAERLQQVVWNLLSNAVKFTPKGGRVQVSLERVDSHAEIAVSDSGQGIHPDFIAHVFERFQQAESGASRMHGGLGLGLAIVRHIVEAHGGGVRVASDGPGKGAVFTVDLPVMVTQLARDADRRHPTAWMQSGMPEPTRLDGLRVLVVDDESDANEVVGEFLASCGAETRAACSAEEARAILGTWTPDVLLSDVGMPGEDGYAFITRLRAAEGDAIGVPAVALTAYASRDDKVRLLSAGFQAHVPKPVDPAELVAVVASLARSARKL